MTPIEVAPPVESRGRGRVWDVVIGTHLWTSPNDRLLGLRSSAAASGTASDCELAGEHGIEAAAAWALDVMTDAHACSEEILAMAGLDGGHSGGSSAEPERPALPPGRPLVSECGLLADAC